MAAPTSISNELLQRAGQLAEKFGLQRVAAQLYVVLLLADRPISLEDLAKHCGVSKPSASIHIRELARVGAVRKVWVADSRRDHYEVEDDFVRVVQTWLYEGIRRRLDEAGQLLELLAAQAAATGAGEQRIEQGQRLLHVAQQLVGGAKPALEALAGQPGAPKTPNPEE